MLKWPSPPLRAWNSSKEPCCHIFPDGHRNSKHFWCLRSKIVTEHSSVLLTPSVCNLFMILIKDTLILFISNFWLLLMNFFQFSCFSSYKIIRLFCSQSLALAQGPEEMCLLLEHQNPSKPLNKWVILIMLHFHYTFYRPQTKRLRAGKIGLQYKIRKFLSFFSLGTLCLGHPSGDVPCASEDMACGYWFSKWRTTKLIWVR